MVTNFFSLFFQICENPSFMLCIQAVSCSFKVVLFTFLIRSILKAKNPPVSWFFLLMVIIGSATEDIAWIVSLARQLFGFPSAAVRNIIVRYAWAANILMYQFLALFINSFNPNKKNLYNKITRYIFIPISAGFSMLFSISMFFPQAENLRWSIQQAQALGSTYTILILMPYTLFEALRILRKELLPRIVEQQLKASINFCLIPHLIANIWQAYPFMFHSDQQASHPEAVVLSVVFLLLAIFYFVKTVIGLRFLNLHSHVHDSREFNFVYDFKTILEDLGNAANISEVKILAQQFFGKAFKIDTQKISLGIRTTFQLTENDRSNTAIAPYTTTIENFITQENLSEYTDESGTTGPIKVLIYDEIAYTHFHEPTDFSRRFITFLDKINADIFLPMYDEDRIIAYIIVSRNARKNELYTNIERDEMIVFSTYGAKVINLLQNRNLNELLKERKDIIDELYTKHQEINKYKESVQSFIKLNKGNSIGILFYKNKQFIIANEDATNILGINPNTEQDEITKILRAMATKIETYKAPQLQLLTNRYHKRFVVSGIPHPDNTSVIFTVYYPELSDVVEELIDHIKDPSNWDYLLYLETTQAGQLINQLIPGTGEILLNFKIELLKVALTKKALLLSIPDDDIVPVVELIHHISLRETLHIITLQAPITSQETAITLFGINPLFNTAISQDPLLEKLNKKGTLFIKNIHFLDIDSQNNLAEFIRYGFYKVLKSERKMFSDVRIICSTTQNLEHLVQENLFSKSLLKELRKTALALPSLLTLPGNEIDNLIEGFSEQALTTENTANKLISFSETDRESLAQQRPVSLHDLKNKVRSLLVTKSKKTDVYEETTFNPAYNISDPKLADAAKLGKYALKDPQILSMLWNKFKNQNKIAQFLGVNRSSVHRRCKDYGIF